ncbi:MAG: hypothetical protein ACLP5H_11990 [Desulfomonilaceae bacterium]
MNFIPSSAKLTAIEAMLLKEMDPTGRIMIRSLDKIHARTGLTFAKISEIASRLRDREFRGITA